MVVIDLCSPIMDRIHQCLPQKIRPLYTVNNFLIMRVPLNFMMATGSMYSETFSHSMGQTTKWKISHGNSPNISLT